MRFLFLFGSAALAVVSSPAVAQDADNWSGFYVGGKVGYAFQSDGSSESIEFDNNLDGQFGDIVRTSGGADAFSPGFCDGAANSSLPADGCDEDSDGLDWSVHAGGDVQFGRIVVGALLEYGSADVEDSVTAFSVTPANYVMTRKLKGTVGLRARAGVALDGGFLPYVTAGLVRAKVKSSFSTTNGVNAFGFENSSETQPGYRLGAGLEKRFGNASIGLLYLYTSIKDDDYRVNVTQGTAGATNPFILVNPNGTQFRRSDERIGYHSLGLTASYRF